MTNANYNSAVLDGVRKFTTALIDMAGNFKAVISDLMGGLPRLDSALNHPVLADKMGNTPILADKAEYSAVLADRTGSSTILADKAEYNAVIADRTGNGAILADKAEYNTVLADKMGKIPVLADKRPITKRINFDSFRAVALITAASFVGGYLPVLADMVARISFRLIDSSAWKLLF